MRVLNIDKLDDPAWLGERAKEMSKELLLNEHRGPGDTIEAAAVRLQRIYNVDQKIILQCWNRPPREMKVSRWMALFKAHYVAIVSKAERAYARAHEEAEMVEVHPAIVRIAHIVGGDPREAQCQQKIDRD